MKKLTNFENFKNLNESKDESSRIEKEINDAIEKYNKNTDDFAKYDINKLREKLLKSAKSNKFRGKVVIRKSANDKKSINANKKFIVYEPKNSTMEDLGSAAANARRK